MNVYTLCLAGFALLSPVRHASAIKQEHGPAVLRNTWTLSGDTDLLEVTAASRRNPPLQFASVFGKDKRVVSERNNPRFRPIVKITSDLGTASGFYKMDQPCIVYTNHHVVSRTPPNFELGKTFLIQQGVNENGNFKYNRKAILIGVLGGYNPKDEKTYPRDVAFLYDPSCLGRNLGGYEFNHVSGREMIEGSVKLFSAGFPVEENIPSQAEDSTLAKHVIPNSEYKYNGTQLVAKSDCVVRYERANQTVQHTCPSFPGDSGSPLLFEVNGQQHVYAMVKARAPGPLYRDENVNEIELNNAIPAYLFDNEAAEIISGPSAQQIIADYLKKIKPDSVGRDVAPPSGRVRF